MLDVTYNKDYVVSLKNGDAAQVVSSIHRDVLSYHHKANIPPSPQKPSIHGLSIGKHRPHGYGGLMRRFAAYHGRVGGPGGSDGVPRRARCRCERRGRSKGNTCVFAENLLEVSRVMETPETATFTPSVNSVLPTGSYSCFCDSHLLTNVCSGHI